MTKKRNVVRIALMLMLVLGVVGCTKTASAGGGPQVAASGSQYLSTAATDLPGISVVGSGVVNARPDTALVDLGVEVVDTDARKAFSTNTTRMQAVTEVLKEMGIQEEDILTINYSMWIEQVYDRDGQPTGENRYHVIHQVRVRVRDLDKTGALVQQALEAGANSVGGITFSVSDSAALQSEARDKALANAKAKAEQLASNLGVQLGAPRQVTELGGQLMALPAVYAQGIGGGGGPVPVSGGEFSVTVDVQLVFEILQ
jgi:uncharacterized protein YggE